MRAGARGPIPSSEAIVQSECWGEKVRGGGDEFAKQPKEGRQMWLLGPVTKIWPLKVEEEEDRSHWTSTVIHSVRDITQKGCSAPE